MTIVFSSSLHVSFFIYLGQLFTADSFGIAVGFLEVQMCLPAKESLASVLNFF